MQVSIQRPGHYRHLVRRHLTENWVYIAGVVQQFDQLELGDVTILGEDGVTYSFWRTNGVTPVKYGYEPAYLTPYQSGNVGRTLWSNDSVYPNATLPNI
ncbi:hypothetical protein ACQ4M3_37300 [Leptolyngbya sp. AN03gr2]|uniref:hypothetical protein n=1 Tax=unclassified Leptolyngbya TaxID=2650499 RepID=UPI003D318AC4